MTVIGSVGEINTVVQGINPDFPRQNLEAIESGECFYSVNGVTVCVILREAENESMAR